MQRLGTRVTCAARLAGLIVISVLVLAILVMVVGSVMQLEQAASSSQDPGPTAAVVQARFNALLVVVTTLYLLATAIIAWASLEAGRQAKASAEGSKKSADMAAASLDEMKVQAAAARDLAAATEAMARELAAQRSATTRPYVVFIVGEGLTEFGARPWEFELTIRNAGKGPALHIQVAIRHGLGPEFLPPYLWRVVGPLVPGETQKVPIHLSWDSQLAQPYPVDDMVPIPATLVTEYKDVEGRAWQTTCEASLLTDVDILVGKHSFDLIGDLTEV